MKPTYYGAHVRIEKRGTGIDQLLVVQRENPTAPGAWVDVRTYRTASSLAHVNAYEFASNLAYTIHRDNSPATDKTPLRNSSPSIGRSQ